MWNGEDDPDVKSEQEGEESNVKVEKGKVWVTALSGGPGGGKTSALERMVKLGKRIGVKVS